MARRKFKHGEKRTWELAVDALTELGGRAPAKDILERLRNTIPNYVESNVSADLSVVSVNSPSRGHYSQNVHPRRTDRGSEVDRVFKHGVGTSAEYEIYEPRKHGVWELYEDPSGKMKVREIFGGMAEQALTAARLNAETGQAFDPSSIEDARLKTFGAIVLREGQPQFRQELLDAYGGKCAMTGCALQQVLEAAHIHPYRGPDTNRVANGLLLRADIHKLFDLGLIRVNRESLEIVISELLRETEYADLETKTLSLPPDENDWPSRDALLWHFRQFA